MEDQQVKQLYNKINPLLYISGNHEFPPQRFAGQDSNATFPIPIFDRTNKRIDDVLMGFNEFTTDIAFLPPVGYYVEITGTNELLKRGYILPHTIKVQPNNTGPVKLLLLKIHDVEDLHVPFQDGLQGTLCATNYTHIKRKTGVKIAEPDEPKYYGRFETETRKSEPFFQ